MNLKSYTEFTRSTAVYPDEVAITYCALGLLSETGEIAGKIKKGLRGDYDLEGAQARADLKAEIGDVLWYLARLSDELGWTLEDILHANVSKLLDRSARGMIKGNGDNR